MDYLYSLYDALVSISVPSDKARAVVDAMERDMGTTLATKQDLEALKLATKQDLQILGRDLENRFALQDQKIESTRVQLELKIESSRAYLEQKIDTLQLRVTVRLGSMLIVGFGLTLAAIHAWT